MFEAPEHTCDVVEIKLQPHPNADSLSLVLVGDFQCIVRTDDWKCGDLAVYVEPDSIVPDTKEFEFLGQHRRIKARKLRGEWSVGLLIPAPQGAKVGDDCMEQLGIVHYEPQIHSHFSTGGENVGSPPGFFPVYDILNFRKYSDVFNDGEEIILTEKLHGASGRYVCVNDQMYVGSRRHWKKQDPNNLWWKALANYDVLEAWCRHHQDLGLFCEIFGQVQNLKYGAKKDELFICVFDILKGSKWLDFDEARDLGAPLPWVPTIYRGPYSKDKVLEFAEGDSLYPFAHNIREGVVIKPVRERTNPKIGRTQLKVVSNMYLAKS